MSAVTTRTSDGDPSARRKTPSASALVRWWRTPERTTPVGAKSMTSAAWRCAALEADVRAVAVAPARRVDGDGVGVDPEVALDVAQVAQGVAGATADVEHDLAALGAEQIVERLHVDPADDAGAHLVVDERVTEELAEQPGHGALP